MAKEEWRRVGDLDYEVSNRGRVRRRSRPRNILKPHTYVRAALVGKNGRVLQVLVHRLVAEAFLEKPDREAVQVNHKDGDHSNNWVENLEWVNQRQNQLHAIEAGLYEGRGEKHGRAKLTERQVREIRSRYQSNFGEQSAIAREYGVSQSLIAKIVRGDVWTHLDDAPRETTPVIRNPFGRKLNEKAVREIRKRYRGEYGEQVALAKEFKVPVSVVRRVLRGKSWAHLKGTRFYAIPDGAKHAHAKLTDGRVRWMRKLHADGVSIRKLAKRYGISYQIARDVIDRKTWKHVT